MDPDTKTISKSPVDCAPRLPVDRCHSQEQFTSPFFYLLTDRPTHRDVPSAKKSSSKSASNRARAQPTERKEMGSERVRIIESKSPHEIYSTYQHQEQSNSTEPLQNRIDGSERKKILKFENGRRSPSSVPRQASQKRPRVVSINAAKRKIAN